MSFDRKKWVAEYNKRYQQDPEVRKRRRANARRTEKTAARLEYKKEYMKYYWEQYKEDDRYVAKLLKQSGVSAYTPEVLMERKVCLTLNRKINETSRTINSL